MFLALLLIWNLKWRKHLKFLWNCFSRSFLAQIGSSFEVAGYLILWSILEPHVMLNMGELRNQQFAWLTLKYRFARAEPWKVEKTETVWEKWQFSLASWQLKWKKNRLIPNSRPKRQVIKYWLCLTTTLETFRFKDKNDYEYQMWLFQVFFPVILSKNILTFDNLFLPLQHFHSNS